MKPRDVLVVCVAAVPIGVGVGWGAAWLWERIERFDWPMRER